jgi:iron-sulfur cluster assembly protein
LAITITEPAGEKIKRILVKRQTPDHWLRISLQGGGCSGFMYHYDFVVEPLEKDRKFELNGIKICVDAKSYLFLNGMEIDYEEDLIKSGLVFNNPNASRSCGCGESISF